LKALRYCRDLGITVVTIDPRTHTPTFANIARTSDDARMRRIQAAAPELPVGVDITRMVLSAKLRGQASNLRTYFDDEVAADTIDSLADAITVANDVARMIALEASAAACYFAAWVGHKAAAARFTTKDAKKIPAHWARFDSRSSMLNSGSSNRKAERPVNAILNYLFALAETEAVIACHTLALDPGLGIAHSDAKNRDSLALDLIEPVRPLIEAWVLNLLAEHTFTRSDFHETPDGHTRLLAPLTHQLTATMPIWREHLAGWVETTAHMLGQAMNGKYTPITPLTGNKAKQAQIDVKTRKALQKIHTELRTNPKTTPQKTEKPRVEHKNCIDCGGKLNRKQHLRCEKCWENQPQQSTTTREKRGKTISQQKQLNKTWKQATKTTPDPKAWEEIQTQITTIPLKRIMEACGISKTAASLIRSGKQTPHPRHWAILQALAAT
jgi:CRISPR-associated endonuclease Cas1